MLQCGDPRATHRRPGYKFDDEVWSSISTARYWPWPTRAEHQRSQFFLVFGDARWTPATTVFGSISDPLKVIDDMPRPVTTRRTASSAGGGHPNKKVTITKARSRLTQRTKEAGPERIGPRFVFGLSGGRGDSVDVVDALDAADHLEHVARCLGRPSRTRSG